MDRFLGLDNIMETLGLKQSKDFEAWWNTILVNRENQNLDIDGFTWAAPQIDFTYEMLEAQDNVEAMAVYVDLNSEPLPSGKDVELSTLTGSIPRQKYRIVRGENDYRKELIALNELKAVASFQNTNERMTIGNYLQKYLFMTLSDIPDAHKNSLNYQVGQMKSTGALEITDKNNPRGIKGLKFSAHVPTENINNEKWVTRRADGTYEYDDTKDPIEAIKKLVRQIRWYATGWQGIKLEMDEESFFALAEHPVVLKKIGYFLRPDLRLAPDNDANATATGRALLFENSDEALKDAFRRLVGVDEIKFHNTIVGVEKWDSSQEKFIRPTMKAFNVGTILIRPTGNIGVIRNVTPLRPDSRAIVAGIFGNRGIVEYRYDERTKTQDWCSELTILAVPNQPKNMYYFNYLTDNYVAPLSIANGTPIASVESSTKKTTKSTL